MTMNHERALGLFRELADSYLEMHDGGDSYTTLTEDELNAAERYFRRKLLAARTEQRGRWRCSACGTAEYCDYESLARNGHPVCGTCSSDMRLVLGKK